MANVRNSLAELINKSKLMTSGLKKNNEAVSKRGVDETFITEFEKVISEIEILNAEQEKLKAQAKLKTHELLIKKKMAQNIMSESKKVVKLALPKAQWSEFGIEDKK